jgi:anti-anti-sigma factor
MYLDFRKNKNSIVVYINSPLDFWNAPSIQKNLSYIIDQHPDYNFIVNLDRVEYMNSAGLGMLIVSSKKLESNNRSFKVSNLNREVKKVIEILNADKIIDFYDTEEEAIKSSRTYQ